MVHELIRRNCRIAECEENAKKADQEEEGRGLPTASNLKEIEAMEPLREALSD
jgi:hypothetical protein